MGMIWLEMISIRAAGIKEANKVLDICSQFHLSVASDKLLEMTVFRNAHYATDISIHLQWKCNPGNETTLGRQLSSALENLGLISHTVWIQEEQPVSDSSSAVPKKSSTTPTNIGLRSGW